MTATHPTPPWKTGLAPKVASVRTQNSLVGSEEFKAFQAWKNAQPIPPALVSVSAAEFAKFQMWNIVNNKPVENYTFAYDSACTPYHMSPYPLSDFEPFKTPLDVNLATNNESTSALEKGNTQKGTSFILQTYCISLLFQKASYLDRPYFEPISRFN
jgi:hypothetical protein